MIFYTVEKGNSNIDKEAYLKQLKETVLSKISKDNNLTAFVNEINKAKFLKDYIANKDVIVNKEDGIYLMSILMNHYNLVITPYKKDRGLNRITSERITFQEYHNELMVILNSNSIKSQRGINFLQYFFSFAEKNNIKIYEIFNFFERNYITDTTINDQRVLKSVNDILQYLQLLFCSYSCSLIKEHKNHRLNYKAKSKILSMLNHEFPIFKYIDTKNKLYNNLWDTREFIFNCHKDTINNNYKKSVILTLLDSLLFGSYIINNDKILDKFFEINKSEFNKIIDIVGKFYYFFDVFVKNKISCDNIQTKLSAILNTAIISLNLKFLNLYFDIEKKKYNQDNIDEELKEFSFKDIANFLDDINELHTQYSDKNNKMNLNMITDNIKDLLIKKDKTIISNKYEDLYNCYNTFTKDNEKEKRIKESLVNNINEMRYS